MILSAGECGGTSTSRSMTTSDLEHHHQRAERGQSENREEGGGTSMAAAAPAPMKPIFLPSSDMVGAQGWWVVGGPRSGEYVASRRVCGAVIL